MYVNTNGLLTFGTGSTSLSNQALPNASTPNNLIAVFWDDLVMRDHTGDERDGRVLYKLRGTAPNRFLIIQWRDFAFYGAQNYMTFEAILHEDGRIQTLYHELTGEGATSERITGQSATFGIEDSTGSNALSFGANQAGTVRPGTILTYRPDNAGGYTSRSQGNMVGGFDDIRATGTDVGLTGDDALSSAIDIGFTFKFYGTDYTQVTASSNGWVGLGTGFTSSMLSNGHMPDSGNAHPMVACLWDDGYAGTDSKLYSATLGTAGNRTFVLMYDKWHFCCSDSSYSVTYEVRFHEATGVIDCVYGTLSTTVTGGTRHLGSGATIGIQNAAGSQGVEVSYNSAVLGPGARISFFPKDTNDSDYRAYGPDLFFEDISGTGTLSTANGDDNIEQVTLPFTFDYYGDAITTITISTNGNLNLAGFSAFSNYSLPSSSAPAGVIAPFWDDLAVNTQGHIYYETRGSAPDRVFVVQWDRVSFLSYNTSELTFQVRLHEQDGTIEYFYGPLLGGAAGSTRTSGTSATVGLQNNAKTEGVQCGYNEGGTVLPGSAHIFY